MTEVQKYRPTSMEESTDEMLQASLVSLVELKRLIKTRAYIIKTLTSMNAKRLWFLVLTTCLLMSCSSDDPENNGGVKPVPTPTPSGANATITFSVSSDNGQGTAVQPFTASPRKPLNATLSQTVTYTDAQGQKQTVEPKATIAATVKTDTIHAADFATLTKLTQPQPKTDTKAGNPKTATRQQLFNIGSQEITFDLSHEIYSYTNGSSQDVELPYLELKSPKFGSATPNETSNTRSVQGFGSMPVVSVTAIRLTPIGPLTRSTTVRETTQYEVTVSFTIDAVTHHTASDAVHPLSADFHYVAVVENVTEVPDAKTSLSYMLSDLKGSSDAKSPFGFTPSEPLMLEWTAESRCSYMAASDLSTHVISRQPKASVSISVASDTIHYAGYKDSVTVVTTVPPTVFTDGQEPQRTVSTQTYHIASQTITISWTQEDYGSITVEDSTVAMPYLQLEAPELVEVAIQETEQASRARSRMAGRSYTLSKGQTRADESSDISSMQGSVAFYEVTARFRQSLKGVNTPNEVAETVEYIVKYIAAVEAKLISTTYEKDYEWLEPWCDLSWRYNYIVRRVRTYSTGEKETDEFRLPTGAIADAWGLIDNYPECSPPFIYHDLNYDEKNDVFRFILTTKTGVPDINLLSWTTYKENSGNNLDWSQYEMIHSDKLFNLTAPEENWYIRGINMTNYLEMRYASTGEKHENKKYGLSTISFVDCFLYLDEQIIDFSEYRMTYDFDVKVEDINFKGAPAKVFTNEIKGKYLGKDFYAATVDTVYQIK